MDTETGVKIIPAKIEKGWRTLMTGLCFVLFGLGGLVIAILIVPVLKLLVRDRTEREYRMQRVIQKAFALFVGTMKFLGVMDYEIVGAEILQKDRGCMIVANHPSLIDYVLIASRLPQCDCLVKAAIWKNPYMKGVVKAAGYIPNKEDPELLLAECSRRLERGNVLLVFPEGTRSTPGEVPVLQRGAAQIAVRTKSNLRVVHASTEPSFLTKTCKWYKVPDTRPFFRIVVKDMIDIQSFLRENVPEPLAARRLNRHLEQVLFPASSTDSGQTKD